MGKNDEPIGFCVLSLNEMLEHTRTGAGVKLVHPKGKDKPCGTIFIRLKAVPRLTEDEIASNLQTAQAALDSAAAAAGSKLQPMLDAAAREKAARDSAAAAVQESASAVRDEADKKRSEEAAAAAMHPAEEQLAKAKAEMDAAIARFKQLEQGLEGARRELASKREATAAAHRRKDAAAAEEKRKHEEQSKAEALAARLKAEAEAAEMMRKCAEANIAQLQKQAQEMERRRLTKAAEADDKECSSADSD